MGLQKGDCFFLIIYKDHLAANTIFTFYLLFFIYLFIYLLIYWPFLNFMKDRQKLLCSMICTSISEVEGPQKGCESDCKRSIDKMLYSDSLTLVNNNDFINAVVRLMFCSFLGFVSNISVYPLLTCSLKFIITSICCVFD